MMNPDELHTGESACAEGWRYRMIHIDPAEMDRLTGDRNWWFSDALRTDARLAQPFSHALAQMWQAQSALERQARCWICSSGCVRWRSRASRGARRRPPL